MNVTGPTVKSLLIAALAVVATGGIGAALGLSGLVAPPTIPAGVAPADLSSVSAADCIDGAAAEELLAGQRVVAVARSEDGAWLGVRTPTAPRVVWVPAGVVTIDEGEADADTLPVGGACPETVIVADAVDPEPVVDPTEEPAPGPGPDPGPAPDTTAPTLGQPSANPGSIDCNQTSTITVGASDDRGVARVEISWSGGHTGSALMSQSGANWSFVYDPPGSLPESTTTTFSLRAFDAAGNGSAVRQTGVAVGCLQ